MNTLIKYLPTYYKKTIHDLPLDDFKKQGLSTLVFDLDNTLITYREHDMSHELKSYFEALKEQGFSVFFISNNKPARLQQFLTPFPDFVGLANAKKPSTKKMIHLIETYQLDKASIVMIGDQVMTDIWMSNRLGVKSVLVDPIDLHTEKWYTRITRRLERHILKKIKKQLNDEFHRLGLGDRHYG
jgi:HAD superfamily phosphatase (TIGR01668 family)